MNSFFKYFILLLLFNTYLFSYGELKKIKLQLSWLNQFQFAGYYMAKENGYYEQLGLDVEIIPYTMGSDISSLVSNQEVDFSIGRENLILVKANNHKNISLIYATFQTSPLVFISKKSSNINNIKDFVNKKIMSTIEDSNEISLKAMITSENIDFKSLNFKKHTHNLNDLINNKIDVMSAYISKIPYDLQRKNIKYKVFAPKDYGFDVYSDFLYTNSELISSDSQTVEKFKNASLRGWHYAYSNMEKSVDVILKKYNTQNLTKEELLFEAKELKKLSFFNTNILGNIDKNKIQRMYDLYKVMGFIKNKIDIKNFIFKKDKLFLFNQEEENYLRNKRVLKVCSTPNWLPYGKIDKDGIYKGISSDFISLIAKKNNIKIEIIPTNGGRDARAKIMKNECDITPIIIKRKDRATYLSFTSPYFKQPLVLVTKDEQLFINKLGNVGNKKIAVHSNTAFIDILKEEYPK
jgi:ABC-type nitrate/sulfonate/bicarbonate transport system substrate-binding protein